MYDVGPSGRGRVLNPAETGSYSPEVSAMHLYSASIWSLSDTVT